MIPKKIHYCWFGRNPLPELAQKCIASWKQYCPDYEIIEWNEDNFDIHCNSYVEEAYEAKKWAFISDVARLYALVNYGGIYMDTDVEVLKPLDSLLNFEAVSGFESNSQIQTGLMASCKGQKMFVELLHEYDTIHFKQKDGSLDLTTNVVRITNACSKYGFVANNKQQTVNGFTFLPSDYLCPKNNITSELHITPNTIVIHHFDGSWLSPEKKYQYSIQKKFARHLPKSLSILLAKTISVTKHRGMGALFQEFFKWKKERE